MNTVKKMIHRIFSSPRRKLSLVLGVVVLLTCFIYWHDAYTFFTYKDPFQREAANLAYHLRDKVAVPSGEIPGLATVTDATKLSRGGVLAGAKNGDKILLFYKAGRVIVYRPSIEKIVAMGPLVLDASAAQVNGSRIIVRSGTSNDQAVKQAMSLLQDRYSEAIIKGPENASRNDYPTSIVIDLTDDGSKTQFVGAITELLGIQKGIVPAGEARPDADVLIIIGNDFK